MASRFSLSAASVCGVLLFLAACADKGHAPNLVLDGSVDLDGSVADDGGSSLPDGSTTYPDGGRVSACGFPGDRGNEYGVGKYCEQLSDCPGRTVCSAAVNTPATPQTNSFFCVLPCDPCNDPPNACGAGATCGCSSSLGGCGCVPTTCADVSNTFQPTGCLPDGGVIIETRDGGPIGVDAGPVDGGPIGVDGGPIGVDGGHNLDAGPIGVDAGPLPPQPVGGGCTTDADCTTGNCIDQLPGGYCTQDCNNGGTCPSGTACQFVPGVGNSCVQSCQTDSDCRDGYACPGWIGTCTPAYCAGDWQCPNGQTCDPNSRVCTSGPPGCRNSSDCDPGQYCDSTQHCAGSTPGPCTSDAICPTGETCTSSGVCSGGNSSGPGAGKVGASCTRSSNCTQVNRGFCLTEQQANFVGGYCSGNCGSDSDCGTGNVCAKLHDQNGNTVALCMQGCSQNNDCRSRYNCVQSNGASFCLNACQENSDCVDPTTQVCNPTTGLCQ